MLNFIELTAIDYKPRAEAAAKDRGFDLDQLLIMSGASHEEILFVLGKYKTNEALERAGGFYRVYIEEKEGARSPFGFNGLYEDINKLSSRVTPVVSGEIFIDTNYTARITLDNVPQHTSIINCILELKQDFDNPLRVETVVEFLVEGSLDVCSSSPELNVISIDPYFKTSPSGEIKQLIMLTVVNEIEG